ncbi:EF-P beta-lysylation protein EpmB [Candidatus Methylocalor cossyra]|uniref:L-lysine 2,3-aminomutase n=1 Tax=Candidatus Methylocalor cossyra TaxID=3108543 RepID=A0ABP1C755_9GAMM
MDSLTLPKPPARPAWRAELAEAFTDPAELLGFLGLEAAAFPALREATGRFPFRVTRCYAARMKKGDPADPLLRQVLPLAAELAERPGFSADPVGDLRAVSLPGMLQKYHGRALLITTGACAIHCRYCFRREFPYGAQHLGQRAEREVLARIAGDRSLREIILSGGDPLVLGDESLGRLIGALAEIPHLQRLRLHTRLPLVLPSRVTAELVRVLTDTRLPTVVVVHANHPAEFDEAVREGLDRLRAAGLVLLNQSVLLRGVNDDPDTLIRLSEVLLAHGVLPYYLHLLDRVRGAGHFEVPEERARELVRVLRERLPGYLVPRLVREEAGRPFKTPLL